MARVTYLLYLLAYLHVQSPGGYEAGETEHAAGDGWDDADNWESFETPTTTKSSTKSPQVGLTPSIAYCICSCYVQWQQSSWNKACIEAVGRTILSHEYRCLLLAGT